MEKTFTRNSEAESEILDIMRGLQGDGPFEYTLEQAEQVAQDIKDQVAILFEATS